MLFRSTIGSGENHLWNTSNEVRRDDASDAGSDASSVCHITEGPLTKLKFDHVNGAEKYRQECWRKEEEAMKCRWLGELAQTEVRKVQRLQRQEGREERRETRKKRREKAVVKAEREERWQAMKPKIIDLLKEVTWNPATMPQLPSRLCPEYPNTVIISLFKAVDEVKLEADTDTEDEDIRPDWSKCYFPRDPPEPPENTELYNRARELDIVLQEERHRWKRLVKMQSERRVWFDYAAPIDLPVVKCKHCVEKHVDDLLSIFGPWWRECGICDSRGRECERDNRGDDDDERKPPRKSFVPSGLIRAAKLGRGGNKDDDDMDGEGSDSESEGGNQGNDVIASQDTTPPPPMIPPISPPVINYSKYGACNDVQREFFEARHRDLQWKTEYLDNKVELGVLGDYIDYVSDRIEAIDREPIHAGHHFRGENYQLISERAEQLAGQQKEKDFWEGLRENLELDGLEVAGELQETHLRHRKDDEECRQMANEVNTLFEKHMKSVPDPWDFWWRTPRYEPQQQPEPEPQETNILQENRAGQTAIPVPEIIYAMSGSWETEREVEDQHEEVMQDEQGQSQEPHETRNTQEVHESQVRQGARQGEQNPHEEPHESQPTQDEVHESSPIRDTPAVDEWEVRRRAHEMYDDQDMLESLDALDTQAIAERQQRIYDRLLGERPERPDTQDMDWQLWDEAGEIGVRQRQECERRARRILEWNMTIEVEVEGEEETRVSASEDEDDFESSHGENDDSGSSHSNVDHDERGYTSAHNEPPPGSSLPS